MTVLDTQNGGKAILPTTLLDKMIEQTQTTSTIAKLSSQEVMQFGVNQIPVFSTVPKAEFVAEGADHGASQAAFTNLVAEPRKTHVTVRVSDEILAADEAGQIKMLEKVTKAGAVALGRALDLGAYHRINPLTGQPVSTFTEYVNATSKRVEINTADPDVDLESAVGMLLTGGLPVNGIALDPKFAYALATLKDQDGRRRYPELGFGQGMTSFAGINAAVGSTVSATPEASDTKVRAFVGDFEQGLRWGVQKDLGLELIRFGDPDGAGDLRRKGQVAIRLEIIFAWAMLKDRFAVVEDKN